MGIYEELLERNIRMFTNQILFYKAVGLDYDEIADTLYQRLGLSYHEARYLKDHGAEMFDHKGEKHE